MKFTIPAMKKRLLIMALSLLSMAAYAQEPDLKGTPVVGSGSTGNPPGSPFAVNEPVSFTLTAGNAGTVQMDYPPTSMFVVNITVINMGAPPAVTFEGGAANYFGAPTFLSLGSGQYLIRLTQNAAIPPNSFSTFKISGLATKALSSLGTYSVGYQANGKPGSYPNTGGDNPSNFGVIDETLSLPVKLVSFVVTKEVSKSQLSWSTTEETNSDRFEIERSLKGKEWTKIGTVASHGESATLKNYNFTDINPVNGQNLYRLKMVDRDATFAYSRIQSVTFEGLGPDLSVYPNPVAETLFIRESAQVKAISLFDLTGRSVYQGGSNFDGRVNVKNLKAGIYLVSVTRANGVTSTQKIVISK